MNLEKTTSFAETLKTAIELAIQVGGKVKDVKKDEQFLSYVKENRQLLSAGSMLEPENFFAVCEASKDSKIVEMFDGEDTPANVIDVMLCQAMMGVEIPHNDDGIAVLFNLFGNTKQASAMTADALIPNAVKTFMASDCFALSNSLRQFKKLDGIVDLSEDEMKLTTNDFVVTVVRGGK